MSEPSQKSQKSNPRVSKEEQGKTRRSQRLLDRATAAKSPSTYSVENIPSARPIKSVRSPSRTESLPSGLVKSNVQRTPVPQNKQSGSYHSGEKRSYHSSEERSYHSSKEISYPSSEVSEQIRSYPSSEVSEQIKSYPSSEAREQSKRYPAEVIKSESESYKVEESESDSSEENQSEQFQFEPSTSIAEFSASKVPTQQYEKFEAPEEEKLSEPSASRPVSSCIPPTASLRSFTSSRKNKYSTSGPDYR